MNPFLMRRKEFMTNQQHIQKLEYIQSTGTQYIDTLYKPNPKTVLQMDIQFLKNQNTGISGKNSTFIGVKSYTESFCANFGDSSAQYNEIFYWNNMPYGSPGSIVKSQRYPNIYDRSIMLIKRESVDFLGITKELNSKTTTDVSNMFLFGLNVVKDNQLIYCFERHDMRLYGCRIYENDVLIKDFVPAKLGNKIGLYDNVSNKFHENKGAGEFLYETEVID